MIFFDRPEFSAACKHTKLDLNSPYFIQPYIELKVKITLADTVLLGDPMYKQNHLMST